MFRFTRKLSSGRHRQYLAKAKYWLWLPDDGFLVKRDMLEEFPYFKIF